MNPKRVTGIGGIFFKCDNPEKIREWYATHLGLKTDNYGTSFEWKKPTGEKAFSVWSTFKKDTNYFEPSQKEFMINFRVENLEWLVEELIKEGVTVCDSIEVFEYGKFVHILDPEGNKLELWQANDEEYDKMIEDSRTL